MRDRRVIALTLMLSACFSEQPTPEPLAEPSLTQVVASQASSVPAGGEQSWVGVFGTTSGDHLVGTAAGDVLYGGASADLIEGGDGDDVLYGDRQEDVDACAPSTVAAVPDSAARFLLQANFGGNPETIAAVEQVGLSAWFRDQLATPATLHLPMIQRPGNMNRGAVTDSF